MRRASYGEFLECRFFDGIRRRDFFRFSENWVGPDGGCQGWGWGRTCLEWSESWVRTHTDAPWAPGPPHWAPQAHFPIFPNFQVLALGHFLESFRGVPCEQAVPAAQKRHGQVAM